MSLICKAKKYIPKLLGINYKNKNKIINKLKKFLMLLN